MAKVYKYALDKTDIVQSNEMFTGDAVSATAAVIATPSFARRKQPSLINFICSVLLLSLFYL
jgi:hypothetical protein